MDSYTIDQARDALERHVRTTRWLRRNLAKKLSISAFATSGAFHVVFQSFTEKRAKGPAHEPYWNQPIDGPESGPEPESWDIYVQVPGQFINHVIALEVPHTAVVKTCFQCRGRGEVTCSGCGGSGRNTCSRCGGDGRVQESRMVTERDSQGNSTTRWESYTTTCSTCGGSGRVTCSTCGGRGEVTCPTCSGARRLKHFKRMTVTWTTHVADQVIEKTELPDDLVSGAQGTVVHQEEEDVIRQQAEGGGGPFRGVLRVNQDVHRTANELIARHRFPSEEKLHRQRLIVRGVPVHEAVYTWGKTTRKFWVYGLDEQVHAPDYPLSVIRISLAAAGVAAVVGGVAYALCAVSESSPRPAYLPPPLPSAVVTAAETPPVIAAPPAPQPLASASGAPPRPRAGQAIIELRTAPAGVEVLIGNKPRGKTPLFLAIPSKSAGPCKGGRCAGGTCTGGKCWGGMCADKCIGAECRGARCDGTSCEGSTCPKGYRCSGDECGGRMCTGGSCDHDRCIHQQCYGSTCVGGVCAGDPCQGGSCTGGTCSGGTCEPVTTLVLRREGAVDKSVQVGPSDGPVVEERLVGP